MSQTTEVFSPEGMSRILEVSLQARPQTFNEGTLGILENHKEFSDWVLDRVRDRLEARFAFKNIIQLQKHHLAQPAAEDLLEVAPRAHSGNRRTC